MKLNNKLVLLAGVASVGDARPTESALQVKAELIGQVDAELAKMSLIVREELPRFNELLETLRIPAIFTEPQPSQKR